MKFLTYDTKKKKKVLVGEIQGELLIKTVNPTIYFMRVVGGYGIQYNALLELIGKVKKIVIKETGGEQWEATPEYWKEHCSIADYGNGKQAFLSLKYMTIHKRVKAAPFTKVQVEQKKPIYFFNKEKNSYVKVN
jgi:hypothetical protein